MKCDVAIMGGGPAGTTVGSLLKKYNPSLDVVIVERDVFPRDHVGESHLPAISEVLWEMGVWDKVEAADFPIKIGATYRWGATDELWDFEFLPSEGFRDEPRPGKYEGQRQQTAFQVDRSIYDNILLDHAESMGCRVLSPVKVATVPHDGDQVLGFDLVPEPGCAPSVLSEPERLTARYFVDGSGESGFLRRTMGVEITAPTALRNIAIWDYWNDAEWAVTLGSGGTRIQVMSLGWGWVWFIPITPTRTSIGLVVPGEHYKSTGKTKEEILAQAVAEEPLISRLVKNAKQEGNVRATKDWNFISQRIYGANWFMVGDACGFADPILSAGMTLGHTGARKVAYTILALDEGKFDGAWLKKQYNDSHLGQIRQHMMFADFWYSANTRFTGLKEYCSEIAKTSGLKLNAEDAFRWLATGGFTLETPGIARASGWRLKAIKMIVQHFVADQIAFEFTKYNKFELATEGATTEHFAVYQHGKVIQVEALKRDGKELPLVATYLVLHHVLATESDVERIVKRAMDIMREMKFFPTDQHNFGQIVDALESMLTEGWVKGSVVPNRPFVKIEVPQESDAIHPNRDNA